MLLAFAACSENDPQGALNPPAIDPDELEVRVSPSEIIANGTEEAVLSVTYEDEDVTAQSKFFANGSELSGSRFYGNRGGWVRPLCRVHDLAFYLRVNGYPSLKINFEDDVAQNTDPASAAKSIRTMTNMHLKIPASTGIAATVSQPDANGKIMVDANIRVGKKGYYRVAAWVVEDGIIAAQADGIGYYEDLSTHNNVLCGASSTSAQGGLISMKQLEAHTTHNYKKTLDLELMGVKDYNKCPPFRPLCHSFYTLCRFFYTAGSFFFSHYVCW